MDVNSHNSPASVFFDSLQSSLLAVAEIGGNRLLEFDEQALDACRELSGNCIAIEITDLEFTLYCHPGDCGIRLSREAPPREVDAAISGRLVALISLAAEEDKRTTSIQEGVRFSGKITLAQKLQKILGQLDIDWEEALSRYTGDIAAVQISQQMQRFASWFRDSSESLLHTSSEYLREEARLSPTRVEFGQFESRVSELKNDVARTEARLQKLQNRFTNL